MAYYNRHPGRPFAPQAAVEAGPTPPQLKPSALRTGRRRGQTGSIEAGGVIDVPRLQHHRVDAVHLRAALEDHRTYRRRAPEGETAAQRSTDGRSLRGTQGRADAGAYDLATGKRLGPRASADPALGETVSGRAHRLERHGLSEHAGRQQGGQGPEVRIEREDGQDPMGAVIS